MAAVDCFLKIDGIPGESQDATHRDELELESFSWGETHEFAARAAGAAAGKVQVHDLHVAIRVSKASPRLLLACASGQLLKSAVLTVRRGGEAAAEFLVYRLADLVVTSYQTGGSTETGLVDEVSFAFGRIEVEYRAQRPDGSLDAPVKAGWDVKQSRAV